MQKTQSVSHALAWLNQKGFISEDELAITVRMFDSSFEFAAAMQLADSIHLHIRVNDTETLPQPEFLLQGAVLDKNHPGYIKFCFSDGLNIIFSSIAVAEGTLDAHQDERKRPYIDHVGIDLRRENDLVMSGFSRIPARAKALGWGQVSQGGRGQAVLCCYMSVSAKHWVYPPDQPSNSAIPLEFSFGALKALGTTAGADLRPAAPPIELANAARQTCCE